MSYLTRITLDIIGLAGFNYSFNALDNQANELSSNFKTFVGYLRYLRLHPRAFVIQLVKNSIPFLRRFAFDRRSREFTRSHQTMNGIIRKFLEEGKKNLGLDQKGNATVEDAEKIGKNKDILSIMLRANATTLGDGARGMSDEEFACQIPTFLFAGKRSP